VETSIGVTSTDLVECPSYVSSAGTTCVRVSAAALPNIDPGWGCCNVNGFQIGTPVGSRLVGFVRNAGDSTFYGDAASGSFPQATSGSLWSYFILDGTKALTPTFGVRPGDTAQFRAYYNQFTGPVYSPNVYGAVRLSDTVDTTGLRRKLRTTRVCKGATTTDTVQEYSAEFWDRDAKSVSVPAADCPTGKRTSYIVTHKVTVGGPSYSPAIGDRAIFTWTEPSVPTSAQPARDKCMAAGANCDLELTPATATAPATCLWGGLSVPADWCTDTTTVPAPSTGVSPTTSVSPTTIVTPTTTVGPTTSVVTPTTFPGTSTTTTSVVVTGDPPPPPPPGDPLVPPPDGEDTFSTCLDDRTEGLGTSAVGWNVGAWIKTAVQYVVAPIFCALYWFFVPAGGWAALVDYFVDIWEGSEVLQPLRNLFSISGSSQCLPVTLNSPPILNNVSVDVGVCGNDAIATLWFLIMGLGVYGLINDVLSTVADFRMRRDNGGMS
jgi:hypothetical protein